MKAGFNKVCDARVRNPPGPLRIDRRGCETIRAYVPDHCHRTSGGSGESERRIGRGNQAVGRLDGSPLSYRSILFLYMYVRKEHFCRRRSKAPVLALDLLLFEVDEAPGVPIDDTREVSNYVAAMNHGLKRLREISVVAPPDPGDPCDPAVEGRGQDKIRRVPP